MVLAVATEMLAKSRPDLLGDQLTVMSSESAWMSCISDANSQKWKHTAPRTPAPRHTGTPAPRHPRTPAHPQIRPIKTINIRHAL